MGVQPFYVCFVHLEIAFYFFILMCGPEVITMVPLVPFILFNPLRAIVFFTQGWQRQIDPIKS